MDAVISQRREVLSLIFDGGHIDDVVSSLRNSPKRPFRYVVTPNVDHLVRLGRRPDLLRFYRAAALCLCDSRVLACLSRIFGFGRLSVIPGSDLTHRLLSDSEIARSRICIIGGSASTVEAVSKRFGLTEVCHHNPPMGFIHDPAAVQKCLDVVVSARADWVFFAVGSPQQEIIAYEAAEEGGVRGIGLCIGASLLFLSGEERRAPGFLQALHLEWAFRLVLNPRRLARRYLLEGPRIVRLLWESRGARAK